jgi:cell division protein FtsL
MKTKLDKLTFYAFAIALAIVAIIFVTSLKGTIVEAIQEHDRTNHKQEIDNWNKQVEELNRAEGLID